METAFGATKPFCVSETVKLQMVLTVFAVTLRRVTFAFLFGMVSFIVFPGGVVDCARRVVELVNEDS
jgi:hypothetical protein